MFILHSARTRQGQSEAVLCNGPAVARLELPRVFVIDCCLQLAWGMAQMSSVCVCVCVCMRARVCVKTRSETVLCVARTRVCMYVHMRTRAFCCTRYTRQLCR